MIRAHPRKRVRWTTRSAVAAWTALFAIDGLALAEVWPWLPSQLHSLGVGACVTVTLAAFLMRIMIPAEAAFLHGMLAERANPGGLHGEPLPMASGDDTGGATVHQFRRDGGGRHARPDRPAPRPRTRN
jgi:hypothetical protein